MEYDRGDYVESKRIAYPEHKVTHEQLLDFMSVAQLRNSQEAHRDEGYSD